MDTKNQVVKSKSKKNSRRLLAHFEKRAVSLSQSLLRKDKAGHIINYRARDLKEGVDFGCKM